MQAGLLGMSRPFWQVTAVTDLDLATFFALSCGTAAAIFLKIFIVANSSIEPPRYRQADMPRKLRLSLAPKR
jgi:hypothetical protein